MHTFTFHKVHSENSAFWNHEITFKYQDPMLNDIQNKILAQPEKKGKQITTVNKGNENACKCGTKSCKIFTHIRDVV